MQRSRRDRLRVLVQFFSVANQDEWGEGDPVLFASTTEALVSFGSAGYDPNRNASSPQGAEEDGSRHGTVRAFLKQLPEGVRMGTWLLLPDTSDRFFIVTSVDPRGVLPGRYPYRLEAVGN